ncbi:hypothetical protein FJV76_22265 [Mesorhizobium sp. WSM4303]|nr:hypothetical protein FJV77_24040 [Mesorhizobium sp. WSM4306]TRD01305.1 hypothetical protein FJV76_22265 [Mesorhizobium sp. WSM4303]
MLHTPSALPGISPARGDIGCHIGVSPIFTAEEPAPAAKLPISPLAGEMPGRAEGGAVPPTYSDYAERTGSSVTL